ncbi:hypothetical protein LNP26_27380 [Klebsiella variicola subsp. variicola]|nr:hypothetical protein [Klebsiella variicola subsp. variicola]
MRDLAMGGVFFPACWLSALSPCSRRCCCNRLFSPSGAWAACPAARCGGLSLYIVPLFLLLQEVNTLGFAV